MYYNILFFFKWDMAKKKNDGEQHLSVIEPSSAKKGVVASAAPVHCWIQHTLATV